VDRFSVIICLSISGWYLSETLSDPSQTINYPRCVGLLWTKPWYRIYNAPAIVLRAFLLFLLLFSSSCVKLKKTCFIFGLSVNLQCPLRWVNLWVSSQWMSKSTLSNIKVALHLSHRCASLDVHSILTNVHIFVCHCLVKPWQPCKPFTSKLPLRLPELLRSGNSTPLL